ncbi:unnamed protein product [Enterobius vermicularis]|uniref:Peptidase_M1 domain-containing protein n=1 Tax=Enterobius vermicularis TaxID=51028 RepID=A0A0N4VDU4_ENTVE|nr:unnamed protein product [Enterobius vermicularis]
MENWGLVTFRDAMLLHDPDGSTTKSKEGISLVVCHEIAHQVSILWMSFTLRIICQVWQLTLLKLRMPYQPRLTIQLKLAQYLMPYHIISFLLKAASIIEMIATLAGEKRFQQSLKEYLQHYAYSNAESNDLWKTIDKHISLKAEDISLTAFAEAWTKQVGFPYLTVGLDNTNGYIIIYNQTRFLLLEETRNRDDRTSWPIPIYYRTDLSGNKEGIKWLNSGKSHGRIKIRKNVKWVVANARAKGYYRVLYDQQVYKEIIRQLNERHTAFFAVERASIINDAFAFAKAGLLPINTAMDIIGYVEKSDEVDRIPWNVIITQLNLLISLTYETRIYDPLQRYMRSLVLTIYDKMGWEQKASHIDRLLQTEILSFACKISVSDCKKQAKDLFYQWKNNKRLVMKICCVFLKKYFFSVPVDLQPLIVEEGVKQGSKADWEFVLEKYKNAKIPSQKFLLLGALTGTTDLRLINRSLDMCLDSSLVRPNILPKALGLLMQNRVAQEYTWRFFRMYFNEFHKALGTTTMLGMTIKSIIENFNTEFDLKEAESFFAGKELGSSQSKLKQALDSIRVNIQWRNLNQEALSSWLKRRYDRQIS